MFELLCSECGNKYEIEYGEDPHCPECGFGPSKCSHPLGDRRSRMVYDHGEEQEIEEQYCNKCGAVI